MGIPKTKKIDEFLSKLEYVKDFIDVMRNERRAKYDEKSEKWQESEKGNEEEENLQYLDELYGNLESAFDDAIDLFEE